MREYAAIETALGWAGVMRSPHGVCATTLPRRTVIDALTDLNVQASDREVDSEALGPLAGLIRARAEGVELELTVPLDLSGCTPFQQRVLGAVLTIPYGETRSYGWIAETIGSPRGAHAVGQAVSQNPLPLLIPCHRVIAADGTLGGYGRGAAALPTKRSLLRREGIVFEGQTLEQMLAAPAQADAAGALK